MNSETVLAVLPYSNEAAAKAAKVRVYFNNHARAKAIKLQNQFTLGEF